MSEARPIPGRRRRLRQPARLDQIRLDGAVLADVNYDTVGRIGSVAYANGTSLTPGYDRYGRSDTTTFLSADGISPLARDQVTRSLGARVTDQLVDRGSIFEDPYPTGDNMVYDGAGRLVSWRGVGAVKETYGYDASTCPLGSPQAGRNTNLVSVTRNGTVTQSSCFDAADRIVSTTGKASMTYDDHGNTTTLGTQAYRYDAADRHMGIDAGAETLSYTRDPLDRLVARQGATTQRYRYANMGDSPDFSVDGSGAVTERYLSLAGGVNVTSRGATQIWSYPNLHGDVIARADAQGAKLGGTRWFSPWGEASANVLDNLDGDADLGYLGRHAKLTEHGAGFEPLINMGARPYHIGLGRFLTTDPIEGGCANDYTYVFGDPVNTSDLSGRNIFGDIWDATGGKVVHAIACDPIGSLSIAAGIGAMVLPGGWGVGAGLIALGAGGTKMGQSLARGDMFGAAVSGATMGLGANGILRNTVGKAAIAAAGLAGAARTVGLTTGTIATGVKVARNQQRCG